MTEERKAPVRRSPLDGLAPTDFVENGNWPDGALVAPRALADYGLSAEQVRHLVRGVGELRRLVVDYETYLRARRTTQKTVARQLGVSTGRLSALRNGTGWPSFRVYATLRAFIPSGEAMARGKFTPDAPTA